MLLSLSRKEKLLIPIDMVVIRKIKILRIAMVILRKPKNKLQEFLRKKGTQIAYWIKIQGKFLY